eukprot:UN27432
MRLPDLKSKGPRNFSIKRNRHIFNFGAYLTCLIFCFGSKFHVASVYILLESYLENNQSVKLEKSRCSKYANFL